MAAKKFDHVVYASWNSNGYLDFFQGDPGDDVTNGSKRVFGVYKLAGFVTVEKPKRVEPKPIVSKLRSKP